VTLATLFYKLKVVKQSQSTRNVLGTAAGFGTEDAEDEEYEMQSSNLNVKSGMPKGLHSDAELFVPQERESQPLDLKDVGGRLGNM
jgi:hypothetical protein